jgi:hypothetical protein
MDAEEQALVADGARAAAGDAAAQQQQQEEEAAAAAAAAGAAEDGDMDVDMEEEEAGPIKIVRNYQRPAGRQQQVGVRGCCCWVWQLHVALAERCCSTWAPASCPA